MYYRLRTTEDSPLRQGWAIALGAFVGCSPLWGIHLPISIFLSRIFRLSVVKTTLATQISNPLFAPFLLFAEFGVGRRLLTGHFPAISLHEVSNLGLKELGLSLVLGSIVLGVAIGMVLGLIALVIGLLTREPTFLNKLVDTVSRRYVNTGILHWEFVRGKLFYDRVYMRILREGLLPGEGTIMDLGCGRGILLSLLAADERLAGDPERPVGWPRPGGPRTYRGIEQNKALYRCGRRALRGLATLERGDLREIPIPPCDGAVFLDVLRCLPFEDQETVLSRTADALAPGGILLIRETDAEAGWRFRWSALADRMFGIHRWSLARPFWYRSADGWLAALRSQGLRADVLPAAEVRGSAGILIRCEKAATGNREANR